MTGASGFVGRQIIPILQRGGAQLLLVGRDPAALRRMHPSEASCSYEELEARIEGFDALLHLAVLNNDVDSDAAEFHAVNVDLLLEVLRRSRRAGVRTFFNVSSTHALGEERDDPYSVSKRTAAKRVRGEDGVVTLYLPLLYGDEWSGRLSALNRLPRPLAMLLFRSLACLKPVAHVRRLADHVLSMDTSDGEVILTDGQARNPIFQVSKRILDLVFAVAVIVLLWWALLIVWLVVRLQSHGPGIFAQRRVGKDGQTFTCLKFRTMASGTIEVGTHDAPTDAITPIGHLLRRTKFDELPQAVNILRNQISLVGPRPCLPVQTELVAARRRRGVFGVKPGITGLAQVNGIDMSDPEHLAAWDSHYAAMQSLPLDAKIILATLRRPRVSTLRVVPGRTANS